MRKSRILVTGGAGFIGAHVTRQLLDQGHLVTVLDDLSGGFRENVDERADFVEGSINDVEHVEELFSRGRFEYVYHLAAYAAEGLSHFIKRFNYQNNLIGSVNLINCSVHHGTRCFVFTSSIAVYGQNQLPMTEELIPEPEDPYGIAKYAVEQDLHVSKEMFDLDFVIFRPHNVYGSLQNIGDRYRNVVGIFMNQIMQGKPVTIFGDGEQTRAFTHIDDVAPVIAMSPFVPAALNEVFNIGADEPHSVNQLAEFVSEAMGVELQKEHLESRNEVKHAFSDHSKLSRVFDYQPRVSLREGVRSMAEWARSEGPRSSEVFQAIEVSKNMPPSWKNAIERKEKS